MNKPMSWVGPRASVAVSAAINPTTATSGSICPAQVMPQISREQHLSHDQEQKPDKEQNEVLGHLPGPQRSPPAHGWLTRLATRDTSSLPNAGSA